MKILSWISSKPQPDQEKNELKARLTHEVMKFERRRNTLEEVAQNVITAMREGDRK